MILNLYILIPLLAGILLFLLPKIKGISTTIFSLVSLFLLVLSLFLIGNHFISQTELTPIEFKECWFVLNHIQAYFALSFVGLSTLMILLTSIVFSVLSIYLIISKQVFSSHFYGLLLLVFTGLNGVFLANDLILFYFFWEIVLIPMYFLIGLWSTAKNKIKANITFFLYTVLGSMFLLAGIIYIGFALKPESFLLNDLKNLPISFNNLGGLFALFLIAFIIKIPLFPFHSWQPTIYKVSPTPITVILSALMAKMGLFAVAHWLLNLFPTHYVGFHIYKYIIAFGLIYASLIAWNSNHLKKIIAYSSIAHLALIFLALFSNNLGTKGAYFQMFSHGLVVVGLWVCIDIAQRKYNATTINSISGLATLDPPLAILMVFFGLANIALPLTSSFIGEFIMLSSIFQTNKILCVLASFAVILSAVYTLRMLGKVVFGEIIENGQVHVTTKNNYWVIWLVAVSVLILGIYPSLILGWI